MSGKRGAIHFEITASNEDIKRKLAETRQSLLNSGKAAEEQASRVHNAFNKVVSTVSNFGGVIAIGAATKELYDFANAFDNSMREVSTISSTVTDNIDSFKQQILELGTRVPIAADAAGKALYQIVSAGYDGADGMKLLEVSAKSAIAGMTDTTTAADTITTVLNAYKMSAEEAENVSDQLFMTTKLGKTTFGDLGNSISQVAPIAASYGVGIEEVLAAVSTLTKSGTPTAQAMTQIRASILSVSKYLGDGAFDTMSFQEALNLVAEKANGSESALRGMLTEMEAITGVLGLTGINAKMAADDLVALGGAAGETEIAFTKMNDSADNQLTILKNNMLNKFYSVGQGAVDIVGDIAKLINDAFETGAIDDVIASIAGLIAAVGAYKASLLVTDAVQLVGNNLKYNEEITALQKLLPEKEASKNADIEAAVASGRLSQAKAEQVVAIRAEIAAKLDELEATANSAAAEVAASNDTLIALQSKEQVIRDEIALTNEKLNSIGNIQNAEKIADLQSQKTIATSTQKMAKSELELLQSQKIVANAELRSLKESNASSIVVQSKRQEIIAIEQKIAASKQENMQISATVAALTEQIAAERALVSEKTASSLQSQLDEKQSELTSTITDIEIAQTDLLTASEESNTAAKNLNTFAEGVNSITKDENTKSSTALFFANFKLSAITAKLNAIILANPYVIAAAAVGMLVYGIYKLCTAQTAAEKAQEAFNKKIEEGKKKQDEFVSKTNELIGIIRTETNTRYMQTKAFKELNDKYPGLLKNMSMEKLLLMDNLELQKLLAQYAESEDEKALFAGLDEAIRRLDMAKKEYEEFQNREITPWEAENGKHGEDNYKGRITRAEEYLKQWQDKLKKHRQIEADARPVDIKIADLSANIMLLKDQLKEIGKLQPEAKKNNLPKWSLNDPTLQPEAKKNNLPKWSFFDFQVDSLESQISAKNAELEALNNGNKANTSVYGDTYNTAKKEWEIAKKGLEKIEKDRNAYTIEQYNNAKKTLSDAKAAFENIGGDTSSNSTTTETKDYSSDIITERLKIERMKIDLLKDGRVKELEQIEQTRVEKINAIEKEQKEIEATIRKGGLTTTQISELTTKSMLLSEQKPLVDREASNSSSAVTKKYDTEIIDRQKVMTDILLSEEDKRVNSIKERYDKEREWAKEQLDNKNITQEQYNNFSASADESQEHEELNALLKKYQTYADKRLEIEQRFDAEILTLKNKNTNGQYDAQIDKAEKSKKEEVSKVDLDETKKGIDFTQLFGNLDKLSLPSMESLRDKIKVWIDGAGKSLSPEDLKAVSDKFNDLNLKISEKSPFTGLISSMSDVKTATEKARKAQEEYDAILAKSTERTQELEDAEIKLKNAQDDRSASVDNAQNAINSTADKGKQIVESAKDVIDIMGDLGVKVPEEVINAVEGIGKMMDGLASIDLTKPLSIVTGSIKMIGGLIKSIGSIFDSRSRKANTLIREEAKNIEAIQKKYKDLERTIKGALGTDYYQRQIDSAKLLQEQISSIDKQIAAENSKRKGKRDNKQLDAWAEEQKDLAQKDQEIRQAVIDELSTTDLKSYSMDLSSSLIEGMANGIEDMGGVVDEKMDTLLKNMIAKQFDMLVTQEAMKPMFDAMAKGFDAEGEDGFGLSDAEMKEIVREGNNGKEKITSSLDSYKKMMEELGLVNEDVSKAAQGAKGEIMANMTEETGSELVGMIRLQVDKLSSIDRTNISQFEFIRTGWQNIADMARMNAEIAANTFRTANNTDCLSTSLTTMNTKLSNIEKNTKPSYSK